jgi:hypothetical protein
MSDNTWARRQISAAGHEFCFDADGSDGNPTAKRSGGARRDRTDDLLLAKQALSQLSYGPSR